MYKKLISLVAVLSIVVMSFGGCSKKDSNDTSADATATPETTQEPTTEPTAEPTAEPTQEAASYEDGYYVNFEDGVYNFIGIDTIQPKCDPATLEIVDMNGSKALKITTTEGNIPFVGIDASSLLGSNVANLRKMTMDLTAEYPDGNFYSVSGKIYAYSGEELTKSSDDWAVYMADKTSKQIEATLDEGEYFVEGCKNIFLLTKETDNAKEAGETPVVLYIDNIAFYDEAGNALPVDTTVSFDWPEGFGTPVAEDWSNLTRVKNEVEITDLTGASDAAWAQGPQALTLAQGGTIDPSLITPDSIITIYYQSSGSMWLVALSWVDGAPFSWQRVADGGAAVTNDSGNICQITYDQLVQYCNTDDFVTYLSGLQCESDQEWAVNKVTIGQDAGLVTLKDEEEITELAGNSDAAWAQGAGAITTLADGTFDASIIKPGCVVQIEYQSTGNMWLVACSDIEGAPFGWQRIADNGAAASTGSVCQITYDQIVAACGTEDISTYLTKLQCESDQEWSVTKVVVGYPAE